MLKSSDLEIKRPSYWVKIIKRNLMKGPNQFSACPGYTTAFYYSLFGFSKYICIVSRKFPKNMTRSTGWLFCQRTSKFSKIIKVGKWQHQFLHLVKISTHKTIFFFFFQIMKLSNSFLNSRFADLGVFANTSELIYLSFFRKHPYIWLILPRS